ncbi:dual-specificity kinase [Malassezia yamatoensis]|uniref:dual-specificity kinase n=1 Tax=Malassezia yamatoensis TaxID=253288 RepID=A0AAJ6CIY1_9BASI|nr:dual-specificity kinase [Malassezia yamatoensis]
MHAWGSPSHTAAQPTARPTGGGFGEMPTASNSASGRQDLGGETSFVAPISHAESSELYTSPNASSYTQYGLPYDHDRQHYASQVPTEISPRRFQPDTSVDPFQADTSGPSVTEQQQASQRNAPAVSYTMSPTAQTRMQPRASLYNSVPTQSVPAPHIHSNLPSSDSQSFRQDTMNALPFADSSITSRSPADTTMSPNRQGMPKFQFEAPQLQDSYTSPSQRSEYVNPSNTSTVASPPSSQRRSQRISSSSFLPSFLKRDPNLSDSKTARKSESASHRSSISGTPSTPAAPSASVPSSPPSTQGTSAARRFLGLGSMDKLRRVDPVTPPTRTQEQIDADQTSRSLPGFLSYGSSSSRTNPMLTSPMNDSTLDSPANRTDTSVPRRLFSMESTPNAYREIAQESVAPGPRPAPAPAPITQSTVSCNAGYVPSYALNSGTQPASFVNGIHHNNMDISHTQIIQSSPHGTMSSMRSQEPTSSAMSSTQSILGQHEGNSNIAHASTDVSETSQPRTPTATLPSSTSMITTTQWPSDRHPSQDPRPSSAVPMDAISSSQPHDSSQADFALNESAAPATAITPKQANRKSQRVSMQGIDDDEHLGTLAGRLSRRSLLALGSLFKTSPRRNDDSLANAHDTTSQPKSRSRLSFRKKRQSMPSHPMPTNTISSATAPSIDKRQSYTYSSSAYSLDPAAKPTSEVPKEASIVSTKEPVLQPEAAQELHSPPPPHLPPKSVLRSTDRVDRVDNDESVRPPPRSEPSAYYTAKTQGSRIPRASSMMRLLTRRPADDPASARMSSTRESTSQLPQSTSMHSVRTPDTAFSQVPRLPSTKSVTQNLAFGFRRSSVSNQDEAPQRSAMRTKIPPTSTEPSGRNMSPSKEASKPVKLRTLRKAQNADAADALRRQRAAATSNAPTSERAKAARTPTHRLPSRTPVERRANPTGVSSNLSTSAAIQNNSAPVSSSEQDSDPVDAAAPRTMSRKTPNVTGIPRSPSLRSVSTLNNPSRIPSRMAAPPMPMPIINASALRLEDERMGDAEIEQHVQRVQQRKLASGAKQSDLEKELDVPMKVPASKRLSPRQAEVIYGNHLCPYEVQELYEYESIYYVGSFARHKHYATLDKPERNYGYDDERGDYEVNLRDHLAFRYEIIRVLGRGSFGQVLQCKDHKTGEHVAIKLIRNKKRFHHQALVEVRIMEKLTAADQAGDHYVVHMTDSFTFREHLCVTMELLSINLYELIKANNFEGFSLHLVRRFAQQTLQCLVLMRAARIVHCDLKPENILLKSARRSEIRVIDYGSSCYENEKVYTYIQSRFYRSPEVILGMDYNMAIDMWSLGCILVEMHTGYPIFPGENEQDQLACMMEVLGVPDRSLLEVSSRRKLFFDSNDVPRPVTNSRGHRRKPNGKSLASAARTRDELFLDFIAQCLAWDPSKRITADAALQHPWFLHAIGTPASSAMARTTTATPRRTRPGTQSDAHGQSLLPRATMPAPVTSSSS